MECEKRETWVAARTILAVKQALRAEARRQRRTQSEVLHLLLCDHYGLDPFTGELVSAPPEEGARDA